MAGLPLIPTAPTFPIVFDDDDTSEEDISDEDLAPKFDLGDLGDSDDEDEGEGEGEDEDDDGEPGQLPIPTGDLAKLLNLGKPAAQFPTAPFPTGGQRTPAQIATTTTTTRPAVPMPTTRPVGPTAITTPLQPAGLRLTIVPKQTTIPQVPQVPTAVGLTLAPRPQVPQTNPIPQLAGFVVAPQAPNVVQINKPTTQAPIIPQLAGLTLAPNVVQPVVTAPLTPALAGQPPAKTVDVATILAKMPGITVATATSPAAQATADINDLVQNEADEIPEDFEARRRLTLKLASIPDYKLNNTTAVTAGHLLMKKSKLGVNYDPDVEAALAYLTALLQR